MAALGTNVFAIANLSDLTTNYKLHRIKGLNPEQSEYYHNLGYVKRRLSYLLRKPVTTIERDHVPYLVVPEDAQDPPCPFPLVRAAVAFERVPGVAKLDYTVRSPENDEICLRFLQFMVQEPLYHDSGLWQPASGQPFFEKKSERLPGNLVRYRGFSVRAMVTPDGGLGFCVDTTSKTASLCALPDRVSRDQFGRWKGRHCIYHYGHQWYEIQISGLSDFTAMEHPVPKDGKWISLLTCIVQESRKPIPPELAQVPHDASVLLYQNNRGEERAAPTPLCFPVQRTDDVESRGHHSGTILPPHERRRMILEFVQQYLQILRFGNVDVRISSEPVVVQPRMFTVPDCEFGNEQVLSVRGSADAFHVSLDSLGSTRLSLLRDKSIGFYCKDPLDRQYIILPSSVYDGHGGSFLNDLRHAVDELFPEEGGYDPTVVIYNDRVPRTFLAQGTSILKAAQDQCTKPGYGLVMIHHTTDLKSDTEDQLAAMVVRELRQKFDLCVAVIHTSVAQECYELVSSSQGDLRYQPRPARWGRLSGYLRNVALSKVLLTNQRWPFILKTPLHADIIVGVDVKHNTAGIVVVGSNGSQIRTMFKTSKQEERLLREQMQAYLVDIVCKEAEDRTQPIKTVVLHRDGRLYQSEIEGARDALDFLKNRRQGVVDPAATLTLLEIPKTSPAPLRLFDIGDRRGHLWIQNPQVGCYYLVSENEGYLCATGRAFPRRGTVNPLHVKRVEGPLPLRECLEDVYYLTVLAWTRPEDCTRDTITTKLNDRFLSEEATEYDADALDYAFTLEATDE